MAEPVAVKARPAVAPRVQEMLDGAHADYDEEYGIGLRLRARADRLIAEIVDLVVDAVPGATYSMFQKGPSEYWLDVKVDTEEEEDRVSEAIGDRRTDILVNQQVWIVVIVTQRQQYD